ncbi:MAG: preprotein translocase subunit YajC [Propionibacteriaceae bacterium]|jgi:preprotein translocase subunit YajC|nr:preprotein translocase subunit YajC [Propionibacteriaceae bacterium]
MIDPMTIVMLVAVVAVFYFLMIRPQQKRAKEQKEKMASLEEGSRVMTVHGIFGTIIHLGEKQAILEISPGVEMTILKQAISTQQVEEEFEYEDESGQSSADADISEPTDAELAELLSSEQGASAADDKEAAAERENEADEEAVAAEQAEDDEK